MKTTIPHILLVAIVLIAFKGFGQEEEYDSLLEYVSASPEAELFLKYGSTPVSLYTGTPEISIPVFTIRGRELEFPISLTYDASGVRVNQIASWVGLGWNLNAGGIISRQTVGLPDDGGMGYTTLYNDAYVRTKMNHLKEDHLYTQHPTPSAVGSLYNFVKDVLTQRKDTKPDVFRFNINGFSGSFIIDYKTNKVHSIENPDIKIEYTMDMGSINSWKIIDEYGVSYFFDKPEKTRFGFQTSSVQVYTDFNSSWYLTKVISKSKKDTLVFNFQDGQYWENEQPLHNGRRTKTLVSVSNGCCMQGHSIGQQVTTNIPDPKYRIKQPVLESIFLNGYEIVSLTTDPGDRADLRGRKALNKINVKDHKGNIVKTVSFDQSYFDSGSSPQNVPVELRYRLRLDRVEFDNEDSSNSKNEVYRFNYYDDQPMPHRYATSVDYWGYNNGVNNQHLVPSLIGFFADPPLYELQGANRKPNINYSKTGTLKEIKYPTGGMSRFYFQSHYVPLTTSLRTIWYTEDFPSLQGGIESYYPFSSDPYNYAPCNEVHGSVGIPKGEYHYFVVEEDFQYTLQYFYDEVEPCTGCVDNGKKKKMLLFKVSDDYDCVTLPNGELDCFTTYNALPDYCQIMATANYEIYLPHITGSGSHQMHLSSGTYGILILNADENAILSGKIDLKKVREVPYDPEVGGLRVYKIEDKTSELDVGISTYYYYNDILQNQMLMNYPSGIATSTASSAVLQEENVMHKDDYERRASALPSCSVHDYVDFRWITRSTDNLMTQRSPHITYSTVSEFKAGNGAKVYSFYNDKEDSGFSSYSPYSRSYILNGKQKDVKVFDSTLTLLEEDKYEYISEPNDELSYLLGFSPDVYKTFTRAVCTPIFQFNDNWFLSQGASFLIAGEHMPLECYDNYIPGDPNLLYHFGVYFYTVQLFSEKLKKTSKIRYFNNQPVTETSEYFYENPNLFKPTRVETVISGTNQKLIKKLKYPGDLPGEPHMNTLIAGNRIAEPVQTETYRNATLLSTQKTVYHDFNGKILPRFIQAAKGSNNLETRVQYDQYDSNGNPVQVALAGGPKISYLWGYNGLYPVAKIENASYSHVTGVAGLNMNVINNPGSDGSLRHEIQKIRSALPNAMVTTYTYKPLVGITSATDPKDDRVTYRYDDFGRLDYIEDKQQNLIEEYRYHYWDGSIKNYIQTARYKELISYSARDMAPDNTKIVDKVYFDGLGRPVQQIAHRQSGSGGDLVTHIEYDGYGRQVKDYLPYERSSHSSIPFDTGAGSAVHSFYNTSDFQNTANPYSEKKLENSPLNRVLKQAAPGNVWKMDEGKEIKFEYRTNGSSEVYYFRVNNPETNPALALNSGNNGMYAARELFKTIIKDENWETTDGLRGTVVEFKNKLGQVVLKRSYSTVSGRGIDPSTTIALDTYYVYDDHGNLTFVLPPKLSDQIVSGINTLAGNHQQLLDELGYRYKYDKRNRLIHKKIPGKRKEYVAYDPLDRIIAIGPVPNPFTDGVGDGWLHTKYDAFNRVIYTLWLPPGTGTLDQQHAAIVQASVNPYSETRTTTATEIDGVPVYYTNTVNPTSGKLLTVNYYDDYSFPWAPSLLPGTVLGQEVYYNNSSLKPKGMPTGTWVRALETAGSTNANTSYVLYDKKSRAIRVYGTNYMGGYTQTDTEYDLIGKVLKTVTKHKRVPADTETVVEEAFEYTPQERLLLLTHKINNAGMEMLSDNRYDALGQLLTKRVGGVPLAGGLQKVDYKYNIRGWLTDINNVNTLTQSGAPQDLFAFRIGYNSVTSGGNGNVVPLYNGNISETQWRTGSDNIRRSYGYVYDYQNRLLDAWYRIPGSTVNDSYNEHLTYDKNGNILSLLRNGKEESASLVIEMDELTYEYDLGNKLINVTDATTLSDGFDDGNDHTVPQGEDDFEYDQYGNLILDRNKGINQITYNHLNLPKKITVNNSEFDGTIAYTYDANGIKLKKTVEDNTNIRVEVTHYPDGFQYRDDLMVFIPHAEGYVNVINKRGGSREYNYVYNYTDHLGNIRVRYTIDPDTGALTILEEDHFYPFGLKHRGYNDDHNVVDFEEAINAVVLAPVSSLFPENYKYKFNSREYNQDFGLNVTEMDFRQYDNALGRFMSIDALTELSQNMTPYRFGFNNPVAFNDPSGLWERLENGSWHTDDKKDIARLIDMIAMEQDFNGGASIAQIDTFIGEEFRGSGGRLSDGSPMLDGQVLIGKRDGSSKGFSPRQVDQISNQIARTGSHWWNEKSGDFSSMWHTYKYYRERSYYNSGGNFSGISLGGGALSYASSRLNNAQGWYSFTQGKTYGHNFYGNQYTERRAAVVNLSRFLDLTGKALTIYGMGQNLNQWRGGYLTNSGAAYLGAVDGATFATRNPGMAAWSFGTSLGKMTVESGWYYNAVHHAPNW